MNECTIEALRSRLTAGGSVSNYDVFLGKKSMGYLLEQEGFAALPGPTYPRQGLKYRTFLVKLSPIVLIHNWAL